MALAPFEFTLQFSRGIGAIDSAKGILRGVTVAEVGQATGHFAFLDKSGRIVGVGGSGDAASFQGAVRRVQLAMDEESLATVVAAAKLTPRVKTREDHDDSIGSRAGFAENFRLLDGKVVCDQTIFESYRNRAVLFETAAQTPELIGLSGDFKFVAEVVGDQAMMRVTRVDAVDIVDQGALTHAGLFSVKKGAAVDIDGNAKATPELHSAMAKEKDEAPDIKAFKQMCADLAAYRAKNAASTAEIDECLKAFAEPAAKEEPAKTDTPVTPEVKASLKQELTSELSAVFTAKLNEAIATVKTEAEKAAKAEVVEFKKQMSALGLKTGEAPAVGADGAAKGKEGGEKPTDFLSLKASVAKERNVKPSEAARLVMQENPEAYRAYQIKLGIIKA